MIDFIRTSYIFITSFQQRFYRFTYYHNIFVQTQRRINSWILQFYFLGQECDKYFLGRIVRLCAGNFSKEKFELIQGHRGVIQGDMFPYQHKNVWWDAPNCFL